MANLLICSLNLTKQSICVLVGKVENLFPERGRSATLDVVDRDSREGHAILASIVSLGEPMTDLNPLAWFAKVVEAGSFAEAARRLKMPISTVSRRIAELEDQLGVRLLERSTRNLRLKSCCAGPDSRSASGVSGRHFGEAGSSSATRRDYVKRAS